MEEQEYLYTILEGHHDIFGGQEMHEYHRYLPNFKRKFYIMYEEDLSNLISPLISSN